MAAVTTPVMCGHYRRDALTNRRTMRRTEAPHGAFADGTT